MSVNLTTTIRHQLRHSEVGFRKACEQVYILNRHVAEATRRFNDSHTAGNRVSRYNLRLRLSVLEGVRNMFYEFAAKKAAELVELQRHILDVTTMASSSEDSDSELSEIAYGAAPGSDTSDVMMGSDSEDGYC